MLLNYINIKGAYVYSATFVSFATGSVFHHLLDSLYMGPLGMNFLSAMFKLKLGCCHLLDLFSCSWFLGLPLFSKFSPTIFFNYIELLLFANLLIF